MYNFCQAQSKSNPISIDWVTEKALSLLNTNDHLGSATNPLTWDSKRKNLTGKFHLIKIIQYEVI